MPLHEENYISRVWSLVMHPIKSISDRAIFDAEARINTSGKLLDALEKVAPPVRGGYLAINLYC
jgi:hypothetical protein